MRSHSRVISATLLVAYLFASSLAGLGAVVICHGSDGSYALESEGIRCCTPEHPGVEHPTAAKREAVAAADKCDDCTDVPLGDLPSRESMTVPSGAKAVAKVTFPLLWAHLAALPLSILTVDERPDAPAPVVEVPPDKSPPLDTIVLLC